MMKDIIRCVTNPVFAEFPLFVMLILLLDYWALYQFAVSSTSCADTGGNTLRFLLITVVFSYTMTFVVYFAKSRLLKILFYFFAILLIVIDIFHYVCFHDTLLTPLSLMLVLETNKLEIKSFINDYLLTEAGLITGFVAIFFVIACVLAEKIRDWFKKRLNIISSKGKVLIGCVICIVLLCGILSFRCYIELLSARNVEETDRWNKRYLQNADRITNLIYCFCEIKATGENTQNS